MHQALLIPEILISILHHLDHPTLLCTAQLVSKTWRGTILNDTSLQQKLFFISAPEDSTPTINPLLAQKFPPWFITTKSTLNNGPEVFETLEWSTQGDASKIAFSYKRASWRRMLVVQPACTTMEILSQSWTMMGRSEVRGTVKRKGGIKMGLVYDYVYYLLSQFGDSVFGFDWRGTKECRAVLEGMDPHSLDWRDHAWTENNGEWPGVVRMKTHTSYSCLTDEDENLSRNFMSDGHRDVKVIWGKRNLTFFDDEDL